MSNEINDWEIDDAMNDLYKWEKELKRLESEEDRDEDAINEAKEMINKFQTAFFDMSFCGYGITTNPTSSKT